MILSADWAAVESWLTALFSRDAALLTALRDSLNGGPKIHAVNAALLYGITPADAKKHRVNIMGQDRPAYDAGKRLSHAWNYGMGVFKMAEMFWIPRAEAKRIDTALTRAYPGVAQYRVDIGDEIFGVPRGRCPRCNVAGLQAVGTTCIVCLPVAGINPVVVQDGYLYPGTRELRTPFGRRRLYPGRRGESLNAAVSQRPQSAGADMWYTTLGRLHGWDGDAHWPLPAGFVRRSAYAIPVRRACRTLTGTYDSFTIQCSDEHVDEVSRWLLWTMERPWRELAGWRFPAELSSGRNWGKYDEVRNPHGLRDVEYVPLSAQWRVEP